MSLADNRPGFLLWLSWSLATGGGALAGGVVGGTIEALNPQTPWILLVGPVTGIAVGFAQWLVLRRYLRELGWRAWMLANAVAGTLIMLAGLIIFSADIAGVTYGLSSPNGGWGELIMGMILGIILGILAAIILGVLIGTVIGVVQWQVLRRYLSARRGARRLWLAVNALAGFVSFVVGFFISVFASFYGGAVDPNNPALGLLLRLLIALLAAGFAFGAITGFPLIRLLREPVAAKEPS